MGADFEDFGASIVGQPRRHGWGILAGAGLGIALAAVLMFKGFAAFLVALIFAIIGGAIGRYWVGEG